MVKDRILDKCGLELTILDGVVGCAVVGINITTTTTTTKNNNIGNIIVVVFDET